MVHHCRVGEEEAEEDDEAVVEHHVVDALADEVGKLTEVALWMGVATADAVRARLQRHQ